MPSSGSQNNGENPFAGCNIIFISDKNIDIRCEEKDQAERLAEHMRKTGFGWLAHADQNEVNMERPHPHDAIDVARTLDRYHGVDMECEHIREEVKELIDDYNLQDVHWDTYTSTAEFANHVAPRIRRLAGFEDSGMGTYREGDMQDDAREDEIIELLMEMTS